MAMMLCKECGQSVSRAAAACPHCGHPYKRRLGLGFLLRVATMLAAFYLIYKIVLPVLDQTFRELSRP